MAKALDFLASDDEAPVKSSRGRGAYTNTDDSDNDVDITSSLIPSTSSATTSKAPGKNDKSKARNENSTPLGQRGTHPSIDSDDDAAFIAAAMDVQNKKAGNEIAKKTAKGKGKQKIASGTISGGGSFQSMGLHPSLLKSLLIRGYTTPTPIQRLSIPSILGQPPRDLVGMARTGSGKTLAYLIPLIQRLNGRHSRTFGVKALVMCPSRELALQILRVGKEVARGWKADPGEGQEGSTRGEAIRWGLIVGGEGMDEQFALMASNPDVIIATPGRLLHLTVEMNLDLKSVEYVVFDEADRLFEMGFAAQLEELLLRLPPTRQTLLFSATLPKSLVEFARAGLQANPKLVRLDADSKISSELRMAFFSVKPAEKEAALLVLLRNVIGVPFGEQGDKDMWINEADYDDESDDNAERGGGRGRGRGRGRGGRGGRGGSGRGGATGSNAVSKKRKRPDNHGPMTGADHLLPHQTIVFCATKHHVEYLLMLLTTAGYACSHIYSSLDQAARALEMARFRRGQTSLLIVTDVAARGIDLPVLEHVVNYDFPPQPRIFVHRVGRTARAGRRGWAWSICTNAELPHLCELQLFLARPLIAPPASSSSDDGAADLHNNLMLGTISRELLDPELEYINNGLANTSSASAVALPALKQVVGRAQKMYERSQAKPSQESYRRAKEMVKQGKDGNGNVKGIAWALAGSPGEETAEHDVLRRPEVYGLQRVASATAGSAPPSTSASKAEDADMAAARAALLAKVNSFRPGETVFEIGAKGATPNAILMRDRRKTMERKAAAGKIREAIKNGAAGEGGEEGRSEDADEVDDEAPVKDSLAELSEADEEAIEDVFDTSFSLKKSKLESGEKKDFRDPNFYMDYAQKDAQTEKGYSLGAGGGCFTEQARRAAFDLTGDDAAMGVQSQRPNASRWDTKKKKFIQGDGTGSDNKKLIRTESGLKLPASFRSGRFDEWRKEKRVEMPKVGETEKESLPAALRAGPGGGGSGGGRGRGGKVFRHNSNKEAKPLDPLAKDYHRKLASAYRKRGEEREAGGSAGAGGSGGARGGRGGAAGRGGRGGRGAAPGRGGARVRNELKSAMDIQKERALTAKRKAKNARGGRGGGRSGSRGGGGGGGGRGRARSGRSR